MALSTVCVSTVGSRRRGWSSHTNLHHTKDVHRSLKTMTSTDDLARHFMYTSPTRIGNNYDYPDDVKSPKKDKKWTISSLFRRKKNKEGGGSDGASSEDEKKNFLGRRRKKSETKRRKSKPPATFDHIVMPRQMNNTFSEPERFNSWGLQKSESELLNGSLRTGSADSLAKRNRKELTKARAEARRTTYKQGSSSDEDSSHISGSSLKIRSEENLRQRDNSLSKRSRAARTERYLKRHSKDGENPYNYIKLSDESNRSLSRSPLLPTSQKKSSYTSLNSQVSSYSGLSTIPPSHMNFSKYRVSNSTANPSYKPPLSMNEYNNSLKKNDEYFQNQRSVSCEANIHRAPSNEFNANILHVQFPVASLRHRNLSLIDTNQVRNARQPPPPPPPRDPSRLVTAHYLDNGRPNTYYFENRSKSFNQPVINRNYANMNQNGRSTSEDQLLNERPVVQSVVRPSSTTPDSKKEHIQYLADKNPRSRKPIQINTDYAKGGVRRAADFWKQLDRDKQKKEKPSPQMFNCQTHVQNQIFLPSVLQTDINVDKTKSEHDNVSDVIPSSSITNSKTIVKQISTVSCESDERRKSSNLEDALNELEAIFNSLGLGDEDLIDRAEQRERDIATKQLFEGKEILPCQQSISKGALSDSSFTYETFEQVGSPKMSRRFGKKSLTVDRKNDDMATRQMDKRRSHTISEPQSVISYLNAPPFNCIDHEPDQHDSNDVPNIVTDDVLYKKLKHSCNSLKIPENQPPFGIPLGPITVAANSDYLHATPRVIRQVHKPRKIPDLVSDDLAFRNLRKDFNKEPALPPLTSEDVKNNNNSMEQNYLSKRKAVRSLSANIGSLMSQEVIERARSKANNNNQQDNITETADAMEIARSVLKQKNQRITDTRKAFMSDTDANYVYERTNYEAVKESRKNFLNGLRNHDNARLGDELLTSKPPHGLSPDRKPSKSPVHHSSNSSLDEFIKEAKETNEKIANDLKLLEKRRSANLKVDELDFDRTDPLSRTLNEIDAVSEHAKLCEKLLECVVDSTELISSTKTPVEEVEQIDLKSDAMKLIANEVVTRTDSKLSENKSESPISHKSEPDYENLISDTELIIDEIPILNNDGVEEENKCKSPFEEHKAELIDSFQKLKEDMEDIDDVLKRKEKSKKDSVYDNLTDKNERTGEECVDVPDFALNIEECAFTSSGMPTNTNAVPKFRSNCEIVLENCNNEIVESSEDLSNSDYLNSLDSLKSPKLVLESASKLTDNQGDIKENNLGKVDDDVIDSMPGTSSAGNDFTRNIKRSSRLDDDDDDDDDDRTRHIPNDEKPTNAWYRDPANMAVACSYGIACALQLASLDIVTFLGIVFAIVSLIAALLH